MTRREIYRFRLAARRGREQSGPRYAVIVQAEQLLGLSTVIVAPASRSAAAATFRPQIEIAGEPTRVLVEQLRAADVERLDALAGRLSASEQRAVDDALALVLDLAQVNPPLLEIVRSDRQPRRATGPATESPSCPGSSVASRSTRTYATR